MIRWLAAEGPCCAGKTTLGEWVLHAMSTDRATIIPDYADFVGGGAGMPDPDPASWHQERLALETLLAVEESRALRHVPEPPPPIVIIDRSVLTLAAHCVGLDRRHPERRPFAPRAEAVLVADQRCRWPEAVIYLDVPCEIQVARNDKGRFAPDSIFLDAAYNAGFRDHFRRLADEGSLPLVWIDGTQSPERVAARALSFIEGAD